MTEFIEKEIESLSIDELDPSDINEYYQKLTLIVESMRQDVTKSSNGNKSAGIRLRKALRLLKNESSSFIKFTLDNR